MSTVIITQDCYGENSICLVFLLNSLNITIKWFIGEAACRTASKQAVQTQYQREKHQYILWRSTVEKQYLSAAWHTNLKKVHSLLLHGWPKRINTGWHRGQESRQSTVMQDTTDKQQLSVTYLPIFSDVNESHLTDDYFSTWAPSLSYKSFPGIYQSWWRPQRQKADTTYTNL